VRQGMGYLIACLPVDRAGIAAGTHGAVEER
jgi:hypothetical protein